MAILSSLLAFGTTSAVPRTDATLIELPAPRFEGALAVEAAIEARRSVRAFAARPLTLAEISQLLWAAQGITDDDGRRSAPSAGALYPLEIYLAAGAVADLPAGIYKYVPAAHGLRRLRDGDPRADLAEAALRQSWLRSAPASLVIAGVVARTAAKYGERARRYVHMEVGAAAENVYLQAESLGLGTVMVGAFDDGVVSRVVGLGAGEEPFALMPVGPRR